MERQCGTWKKQVQFPAPTSALYFSSMGIWHILWLPQTLALRHIHGYTWICLCSPGWSQTPHHWRWSWTSDLSASSSWVLGLQACTTTQRFMQCWELDPRLAHARHSTNQAAFLTAASIFLNEVVECEDRLRGIHNTVSTRSDLRFSPWIAQPLNNNFSYPVLTLYMWELKKWSNIFLCHKARIVAEMG